jgi:hypothetical protein
LDQRGRADYYIRVDSFWAAAVAAKLSGIRTKLLAGLLMLASFPCRHARLPADDRYGRGLVAEARHPDYMRRWQNPHTMI